MFVCGFKLIVLHEGHFNWCINFKIIEITKSAMKQQLHDSKGVSAERNCKCLCAAELSATRY